MDSEIQLISDGDGVALIGTPADVDAFLTAYALESQDLGLERLSSAYTAGSAALQAGAGIAASGKWLRLTDESAQAMKFLPAVRNSTTKNLHATLRAPNGQFAKNLQFVDLAKHPAALLTNPALLTGAAGIMAQLAMQAAMDEITDYLAVIDEKVDDILRSQKDAVIADMVGVHLVIEEAMTIREHSGKVGEVTWSKVQTTSSTIARTQAYALRQLDAIAEKMEKKAAMGDLAKAAKEAEAKAPEWLAVLARCFQLQDAVAILELDRVLDASPDELETHRVGLRAARQNRLQLIHRTTEQLLDRMNAASERANAKVLLQPMQARTVVEASNRVAAGVLDFQDRLGIEDGHESPQAKRWRAAVAEARDRALETGIDGAEAAKHLGDEALGRARATAGRLSSGVRAFKDAVRSRDEEQH